MSTHIRLSLVGVLCVMLVATHAPAQENLWETYIKAGMEAYQQATYAEAEKQWSAALQEAETFGSDDPRLATTILKVVNSAFYGLPSQVASLDRAIIMLGLSAVKNIALATSLSRLFKPGAITEQFAARDLWSHSIAVGVCAKLLTKAARGPHADEAFVAGLVHDMGLLIEHQLFREQLKEIVNRCMNGTEDFCTVEAEIIGANHQAFGAALAAKWKFPPGLRYAIAYHHNPMQLKPEFRNVATMTYVADTVCCRDEYGFWLTAHKQELSDELLATVGLTPAKIEEVSADLPDKVEEAEGIFIDP